MRPRPVERSHWTVRSAHCAAGRQRCQPRCEPLPGRFFHCGDSPLGSRPPGASVNCTPALDSTGGATAATAGGGAVDTIVASASARRGAAEEDLIGVTASAATASGTCGAGTDASMPKVCGKGIGAKVGKTAFRGTSKAGSASSCRCSRFALRTATNSGVAVASCSR